MCSFAEFNRPKLDNCNNLQKKHCSGEQIFLMEIELRYYTHHIRQMYLGDLSQIWKYSILNVPIC